MNKLQFITILALTTTLAGATVQLIRQCKQRKRERLTTISDAGYETAYDVHFPLKYRK